MRRTDAIRSGGHLPESSGTVVERRAVALRRVQLIQRKPRKTKPTVVVTFTVPAPTDRKRKVSVVGDFNDWDPSAHRLKGKKDADTRSISVSLAAGRSYRFRYVTDDGDWFDDEAADRFEPNAYGGKDGVLDLSRTDS
jgi:1,4-alpha-glucan branching enzyme